MSGFALVADILVMWQPIGMREPFEKVVADWVAFARSPDNASDQQRADAMSMYDLSREEPELSWSVIRHVLNMYPKTELLVDYFTEAKGVVGLIAAGPLEDLLEHHGASFIDRVEALAYSDSRMRWALRGMYFSGMTDEIQRRLSKASSEGDAD